MTHRTLRSIAFVCGLLAVSDAFATKTAFRLNDLDLRDAHFYVSYFGCRDITDVIHPGLPSSFNSDMQSQIQTDADMDGALDVNLLLIFDPLDQAGSGGTLTFGEASCTAPVAGTSCERDPLITPVSVQYHNQFSGSCLSVYAGTTYGPYAPEVTTPSPIPPGGSGFKTDEASLTLRLFGSVDVPFSRVRIGALYVGTPATNLNNGLIRAFLPKEDADAIIVPVPVVGNQTLSSILPGLGNCATHSDRDTVRTADGCMVDDGWWFYWNFTATVVPYDEFPTSVEAPVANGLWLDDAIPNPFNPSATLRYRTEHDGFVRVSVFDAAGRWVADLVRANEASGEHTARWDGHNAAGAPVSSGVYFVRLESAGEMRTQKIVLLK